MRSTLGVVLMALPLVMAIGCKKKPPEPPPPPPPVVQEVDNSLQVTSISPASVEAGAAAPARLFGGGFVDGAVVTIGGQSATGISVLDPNTISLNIPALPAGTHDVIVSLPDGQSATLRGGVFVRDDTGACRNVTVNFNFDSSGLAGGDGNRLDELSGCYQKVTGSIRIEGHADERGTVDYNLALGQRRADAVKQRLTGYGVAAGKMTAVSYGEERPADSGHNEAAWAKNRRAEISAE